MRPYMLASILLLIFYTGISQDALTARLDPSGQESDLLTSIYHRGTINLISITPSKVSISEGFTDPDFGFDIRIKAEDPDGLIRIESDFDRSLQYTVSNIEGRIRIKRVFVREDVLDTNKIEPGSYALYFFRGKKIVKALLLEKSVSVNTFN
jgi:hypothetical protein